MWAGQGPGGRFPVLFAIWSLADCNICDIGGSATDQYVGKCQNGNEDFAG